MSIQEEVEEVEQKLKEAEQGQTRSGIARVFMQLVTPALLEALVLTFIAGEKAPEDAAVAAGMHTTRQH